MNLKKWFRCTNSLVMLFMYALVVAQNDCPEFTFPLNGDTDIAVNATFTWAEVIGYNGYILSIGTTPQGKDILNAKPIGTDTFYTPPVGLPANSLLYATLSLVPYDGPPIGCQEISFTTIPVTTPPGCSILVTPDNNAASVTIITDIEWAYAPTATGYILSIGTEPNGSDIVNALDMKNTLSYDPPNDFPQNANIYVTVTPYNEHGAPTGCIEEVFTTSMDLYICDPYIDDVTGTYIYPAPQIELPNTVGICSDELPYRIMTNDLADGFRWYKTNSGSEETLLSQSRNVDILGPGRYRLEAFNVIETENGTIECTNSKLFDVVSSEPATIIKIDVLNFTNSKDITIVATGGGQYEYALDDSDGPYQDSPIFTGIPYGQHMAYVRDKNGCGITQRTVDRDIDTKDFPSFFTPNGDGINDFWQFIQPPENFESVIDLIFIYDRYGNFIHQINPNGKGWDGHFNNSPLPETDYWFKATFINRQDILGHFSLKR
ncbi:gliding motility-associated C-terminal domain-containing protein [Maribacter sedimenticola]|uniref:Gliding motility-associated C-terminal domain-containing protein n=1 Tax=Maribacter sedimenticola TaxID=228956 RepID=A0ABY1SKP0_9FLAO|nr:T9SS type B sorting domain-containing protein [Maribacter sedimenticola]SNR71433.1 gliding motility-associated C-terminal domain-containing protein [Maribacter sedimenticola]